MVAYDSQLSFFGMGGVFAAKGGDEPYFPLPLSLPLLSPPPLVLSGERNAVLPLDPGAGEGSSDGSKFIGSILLAFFEGLDPLLGGVGVWRCLMLS